MKKTTKIVSIILALVMAMSCFSAIAFAEEVDDYDKRIDGWNANYDLFLDHLFDDNSFTSWKYVEINEKAMKDTMTAWTALALYDEAWRNYATHHISIEQAELILLALIEKADYEFDDGYVDEFVDVLELAQDAAGIVEKAADIIKAEEFTKVIESNAWGTTWKVIGDVTKIAHAYQTRRDQFVEEYSRVLSVQLANQYYLDLLQHIADTTPYDILEQAAKNLIDDMNANVQTVVNEVLQDAVMDGVSLGFERLVELAFNSNVYTATVLEIYDAVVSVADFLWNTNEVYPHMETVLAAYYFQDAASDWAAEAYYQEEAEKSFFAIDLLMTTRKVCEEALVNFKNAENGGAVGRVKNQLHGTLCEDTLVNIAGLEIMRSMMFDLDPSEFRLIKDSLYVYCPVSIDLLDADNSVLYTVEDGVEKITSNEYGVFKTIFSDFGADYLKVMYLYDDARIRLSGTNNGYVTLIHKELLDDGTVNDWSFTDVEVTSNARIIFDTEVEGTPKYKYTNGAAMQNIPFNDVFIESEYPEYTAKDVVDAGGEIIKDEAKSIWDKIVEFFEMIGQWFRDLFGIKD